MLSFPNAKINIGLHITGKRPDGYHNLETIFYPVQVKDALEITDAPITNCAIAGIDVPGSNEDNIVLKAYNLLSSDHSLPPQSIHLLKNIPVGAGLGGGSADAAFMIKMLNERFSLRLDRAALEGYARQLGADCAFFIQNEPAYAIEKGDVFEAIQLDLSAYSIHLVKPPVHVSTQDAYAHVQPVKPTCDLKTAIKRPIEEWRSLIKNDFESSVFVKYPEIKVLKDDLYAQGAIFAQMSGSGSSVYGLFKKGYSITAPAGCTAFYDI